MGRNKYDPVDNWAHTQVSKLGPKDAPGPTTEQQRLEAQQATEIANLNLEENAQRKTVLSSMMGTRMFRGSALSRAVAGNTDGTGTPVGAPSRTQRRGVGAPIGVPGPGLFDSIGAGSTPAGGAGASGGGGVAGGGRAGGAPGRNAPNRV